jgi:LuxR family maltose regulon positive regulatory protein
MVPELPVHLVSRPRLLAAIDRAKDTMTTLVCAPAGSGKTLLLAEWVRRRGAADTAWASLDEDDNEDRRFWSTLLNALALCPSVPRVTPLRALAVPPSPSANLGFLADVFNALDDLPGTVRLVLDDVHELIDPEPLHGLEMLLRHQPAKLRLVLSSRHDPPLRLARLRPADQLAELRADELKFSLKEAEALLEAAEIELRSDQLRQLLEQTEGWAAGLRLAAASLRETDDPGQFLADFAGNDRSVADYLIDEVLSRLPDEMREFLRTISVCDQVSAGLAGALSGRTDAGAMLDALSRKTLLARAADQHWYRMHALVRSHLLADVSRQTTGRAAVLHGVAADWFTAHGQSVLALDHARLALDVERVASLLRRQAVTLTVCGDHEVVRRALAVLADKVIKEDSLLALVSVLLHVEMGEPKIADLHLAHAEAAWPAQPTEELQTLRQLVYSRQAQDMGDVEEMMRTTENLDAAALARQPALDALAMLHRGTAVLVAGHAALAREQVEAALDAARDSGQDYVAMQCLTTLGGVAGAEGDFPRMNTLAKEVDTANAERRWQQTVEGATACALLAYGAFLRAEPAECMRQAVRAARAVDAGGTSANRSLNLFIGTLSGAARFEMGDRAAGLRQICEARVAGGDTRFSAHHMALSAVLEHRAAVLLGWSDAAREVMNWSQVSIPDSGELLLMKARGQLGLGRHGAAGNFLRPLLDGAVTAVLPWSIIEAWLVETAVALHEDEEARARRALKRALSLAESMDVLYPLVSAEPEVIEALTRQLGKLGASERFAGRVLGVRRSLHVPPVPVLLTERELSVLRLLPTLRSFEEIAQDLTVSLNTVKTHVRAIYTKLAVRKRRDAVAVGVKLGFLEAPTSPSP